MRVSIVDGKIVGYNTISEQAAKWNTTVGAIKQMVNRGQIYEEDYICLIDNISQHNIYFFAEDLEKPTRKTKTGKRIKGTKSKLTVVDEHAWVPGLQLTVDEAHHYYK